MTTSCERPVTSSTCSSMVMPGCRSLNWIVPPTSVRIENVYGSHSARSLAELDRLIFLDAQARAVDHVVALLFAALFVDDGDEAVAVHGDQVLVAAAHDVQVDEADEAAVAGLELWIVR